MKILVVGGGAREHTLIWKLAQSPRTTQLFAAPGNAGTARIAKNLDIKDTDVNSLGEAVKSESIELVVVGPEAPLAVGVVDHFQALGVPVFGPTRQATEIESSKVFSKELMQKHGIPCAESVAFSDYAEAKRYVEQQTPPIVIKADGLASGKGVVVADSVTQAVETLSQFMEEKSLGASGDRVIIEEHLSGRETSAFVFTDGQTVLPLAYACDYKRVFDSDQGPNTGGMGSYSPPPFLTPELAKTVQETIMRPAVAAMTEEGRPYRGVLYGGLMITSEGLKVIEFNARMGDPEAQVVLPLLKTDLVEIILAVINGNLEQVKIELYEDACVGVAMAPGGYPGSYQTGYPITGLDELDEGVVVFHAGTKLAVDGQVLTSGGRTLTVVAKGKTTAQARKKVYDNISRIHFKDCHYRKDIALIRGGS
ncbi:MAG: phosphoribosylamine--glycine ligase [Dehalococcoidales bacterium]|nr:MAG: phosphoribosylamine--glycine ligase [Dehalococcoidales bacterium]